MPSELLAITVSVGIFVIYVPVPVPLQIGARGPATCSPLVAQNAPPPPTLEDGLIRIRRDKRSKLSFSAAASWVETRPRIKNEALAGTPSSRYHQSPLLGGMCFSPQESNRLDIDASVEQVHTVQCNLPLVPQLSVFDIPYCNSQTKLWHETCRHWLGA